MKALTGFKQTLISGTFAAALVLAPAAVEKVAKQTGFELGLGASAEAQAAESARRRLPGISEKIFKDLGKVQALTNPELEENPSAKADFPAAYRELNRIEKRCGECNNYEKSQIYNMFAYVAYTMEKYAEAV